MTFKEDRNCIICTNIFTTLVTSKRKTCSTRCSTKYHKGITKVYQQTSKYKARRKELYKIKKQKRLEKELLL